MALSTLARLIVTRLKAGDTMTKVVAKMHRTFPKSEVARAVSEIGKNVPKVTRAGKKLTPTQRTMAAHKAGRARYRAASDRRLLQAEAGKRAPRQEIGITERYRRMRGRAGGIDLKGTGPSGDAYRKFMSRKRFPRKSVVSKADRQEAFKFQEWARKNGKIISNDEAAAVVNLNKQRAIYNESLNIAAMQGPQALQSVRKPVELVRAEAAVGFPVSQAPITMPTRMNPGLAEMERNRLARLQYESQLHGLGNAPTQPSALDDMFSKFLK
jgi:hypothetical protein